MGFLGGANPRDKGMSLSLYMWVFLGAFASLDHGASTVEALNSASVLSLRRRLSAPPPPRVSCFPLHKRHCRPAGSSQWVDAGLALLLQPCGGGGRRSRMRKGFSLLAGLLLCSAELVPPCELALFNGFDLSLMFISSSVLGSLLSSALLLRNLSGSSGGGARRLGVGLRTLREVGGRRVMRKTATK